MQKIISGRGLVMRESVVFYKSFYEAIKELPEEQQAHLYNAVFQYQFDGKEPELESGIEQAMWKIIKPLLMANNERFENGKKGGRPKKEKPENTKTETIGYENENHRLLKSGKNENLMSNVVMSNELCVMSNAEEEVKEEAPTTAVSFYLENINPVASPHELEEIQDYEKDLPADLVIHAMKLSIEQRKTSLKYIKGILRSWKSKGILCLKQALEEAEERNKPPSQDDVWARFLERHKGDEISATG